MTMGEWIAGAGGIDPKVLGVIALAVLVRSTLGFGDALVAMPLLVLAGSETRPATALVAAVSLMTAAAIFAIDGRRTRLAPGAWVLALYAVPGLVLGLWFLESASVPLLIGILGGTVAVIGLLGLLADPTTWRITDHLAPLFGVVAGCLGGAFNVHGPPLVVYGTARGWSPEVFRSTCQAYFLAVGVLLVAGHGLAGRYSPELLVQLVACLPVVAGAGWLGGHLNRRLPLESFRKAVYGILVLLGLLLLLGGGR
jgi:uncharacterized membrane protein YfcA|tara:strand:- start:25 stop:786 length:762 start_codon:yes stop_codon:yes gene_type:complete